MRPLCGDLATEEGSATVREAIVFYRGRPNLLG
ncbi:hypothetical protein ACVWYO_003629 [Sphingomonas sp. UYP23]